MIMGVPPLVVGDRVRRAYPPDVHYAPLAGTVVEVYQSLPNGVGDSIPLYAIDWGERGYVERGYMREGLVLVDSVSLAAGPDEK